MAITVLQQQSASSSASASASSSSSARNTMAEAGPSRLPSTHNHDEGYTSITDELRGKSRIDEKRSWAYVFRSGIAGGVAGCVAKTAIAPLDRVKILFQANNPEFAKYSGRALGVFHAIGDIFRSQGALALFQGHSATLVRIFPYAAIKYMAYDKFHFLLIPSKEYETSARLFLAGSASGVLSVFVTYPLELIRVRLAYETKRTSQLHGIRDIVHKIYTEGVTEAPFSGDARRRTGRGAGSSTGAGAATATATAAAAASGSGTAAGASSSASAGVSSILSGLRGGTSGSLQGGATDAIAATIGNSYNVLSNSGAGATAPSSAAPPAPSISQPSSSISTLTSSNLLARYPLLKFYRGFTVTVLGMIPYAGTSFVVFGRCRSLLHSLLPPPLHPTESNPRRWYHAKVFQDLTAGGLAGAISQTAAYPFEVIRRRQQVGGVVRPGAMLGMWETARWIWVTSGPRGFYVGLSIGFLKVVPMTSISFAMWLGMKRWMDG
ncbi:hypothetical protein V8E36_000902 [Tilletia maclaganii]